VFRAVAIGGDVGRLLGAARMLDSQKLRELLHPDWSVPASEHARPAGWTARYDLQRGFATTVEWYRRAGWLPQQA